jgi:hypothetical protein
VRRPTELEIEPTRRLGTGGLSGVAQLGEVAAGQSVTAFAGTVLDVATLPGLVRYLVRVDNVLAGEAPCKDPIEVEVSTDCPYYSVDPSIQMDDAVEVYGLYVFTGLPVADCHVDLCPAFDANGDRAVNIDELLTGVNNALTP